MLVLGAAGFAAVDLVVVALAAAGLEGVVGLAAGSFAAAGNQEFFFWASIGPGSAVDSYSLTALIDSAVAAAADPP